MTATPAIAYAPRADDDSPVCRVVEGDERKDPRRCVIANYLRESYPWMRSITVGEKTIRVYDYRCQHNPEGLQGKCEECSGRCLVWATPLVIADVIREFDRGGDPVFPGFALREDEARVMASRQDAARKRKAMAQYNAAVRSGEIKPNRRSKRSRSRSVSARRHG